MALNKKIPERMCVACRQMKPKSELIRIVKTSDGVAIDVTGKLNGRGVYLCKNTECFTKAKKNKGFAKTYGFSVEEVEQDLVKVIEK